MPSMAARPFCRSAFNLKVRTSGSSWRTHESSAMSPGSASSVCGLDAKPVPASCMHVSTMIWSHPAVGTASSDAKQPAGTSENLRSWDPDPSLDGDDVEEAKHRRAAVLDLHNLISTHIARLDEAERVVDAQRREHPDVALREHLDRSTAALNCESSDVAEQRLGEVKWGHHVDLSRRRDDTLQERHRPGNRTLAEEAHQTDHGEAAVVDLRLQLLGLPLVALVLVEAERIVQVQRNRVGQKWAALRVFESS